MRSYRGDIETLIPQLRQFARALVSDHRPDLADDLVHDALTHALRSERHWMGEDVAAKIYTRLLGANRVRLRAEIGERRSAPATSTQAEAKPGGPPPAYGHPLGHGLEGLSLSDREALLLVVLCRLDYSRVAEILGVPIGTLVTRLTRAREQLGSSLWAPAAQHRAAGARDSHKPRTATHLRLVKS